MGMRAFRPNSLLLFLLFSFPLGSLAGQERIVGVAFDSLRSQLPVVNGEIILVGTGRRTHTDSAGRFTFRDVDNTAREVIFWAPWLDSLGLPPLRAEVSSATTADRLVILSTPSLATYQRQVCGTELSDADGVLLGETRSPRGEARAGIVVAARWTQTILGPGRHEQSLIATVDTTSAAGLFTLCGVPIGTMVSIRALGGRWTSAERMVAIDAPVQRHDLIVGSNGMFARVTGRVVNRDGTALTGATISMSDDSTQSVVTDSSGLFVFAAIPQRSAGLVVRAVGYVPEALAIDPFGSAVDMGTIALEPLPPELAAVHVTASPFERERLEFERRRQGALGDFITDEMLERIPTISANVVASMAPRLRAQQPRSLTADKPTLMMRRGFAFCAPRFFVDGLDVGQLEDKDERVHQWNLLERAKRIEVYTANQAPAQFNDFDGCGSVVVWTR